MKPSDSDFSEIESPVIIAFLGKGGSGKSILSSLTGKIARAKKRKILYIDADPAMGLATALAVEGYKTMGQAREEIIHQAKAAGSDKDKEEVLDIVDYLLLEALIETPQYGLLVMGQTDTIGCFCPLNTLLRSTIKTIASQYDVVIIDAEAGFEQISRQVTDSVQYPILLTDNSLRGVRTTILAKETIDRAPNMSPKKTGVIFNRVAEADAGLCDRIGTAGLRYYGSVPVDSQITESDRQGLSALKIPDDADAIEALKTILENEGIL